MSGERDTIGACHTLEELVHRVKVQGGHEGDIDEDAVFDAMQKIVGKAPMEYGDRVVVVFDDSYEYDGERIEGEYEEHGYIMGLPGHEEGDPEMGGIVHIPHTKGEKDDGGPVWITLTDLVQLPDVKRVELRATTETHTDKGEGDG